MKKIFGLVLGVLLLTSCFETFENYVINPDGTGKVSVRIAMPDMPAGFGAPQTNVSGDDKLKKRKIEMIEKSKGVSAWSEVNAEMVEGKLVFTGTAYFDNVEEVKIESSSIMPVSFIEDPKKPGDMLFKLVQKKKEKKDAPAVSLTEEEIQAKIEKEKSDYNQNKAMMAMVFNGMSMTAIYKLPGKPVKHRNMVKNADGTFTISIKGEKLQTAIDTLMQDDEFLRAKVQENQPTDKGQPDMPMDKKMNKLLFGQSGVIGVRLTGDMQPYFNYEKELKKAAKAYSKIKKTLGIAE